MKAWVVWKYWQVQISYEKAISHQYVRLGPSHFEILTIEESMSNVRFIEERACNGEVSMRKLTSWDATVLGAGEVDNRLLFTAPLDAGPFGRGLFSSSGRSETVGNPPERVGAACEGPASVDTGLDVLPWASLYWTFVSRFTAGKVIEEAVLTSSRLPDSFLFLGGGPSIYGFGLVARTGSWPDVRSWNFFSLSARVEEDGGGGFSFPDSHRSHCASSSARGNITPPGLRFGFRFDSVSGYRVHKRLIIPGRDRGLSSKLARKTSVNRETRCSKLGEDG